MHNCQIHEGDYWSSTHVFMFGIEGLICSFLSFFKCLLLTIAKFKNKNTFKTMGYMEIDIFLKEKPKVLVRRAVKGISANLSLCANKKEKTQANLVLTEYNRKT